MKKTRSKKEPTIEVPELKDYYEYVASVPGWQACVDGNISMFRPELTDWVGTSSEVDITMSSDTNIFWERTDSGYGFQLRFRCEVYKVLDSVFLMDNVLTEYGEVAIGYCTTSKNAKILIQIDNKNHLLIFGCNAKWSAHLIERYLSGKMTKNLATFLGSDHRFPLITPSLIFSIEEVDRNK
jgi:hypothetical protein